MSTKIKTSAREIQELVKRYVAKNQPKDFKLVVKDGAVMHIMAGLDSEDNHWYVVVRHDPELPRFLSRYSNLTMKIEEQIKKNEGITVYLQSILPPY